MAGGAAGALLGSLFHIGATSYGVTGIPGFLITLDYTLQYAIVLAVSFVVAFGLTWFVWKEENEEEAEEAGADGQQGKMEKIGEEAAVAEGGKHCLPR